MRPTRYNQHARMGEGDPLREAGLDQHRKRKVRRKEFGINKGHAGKRNPFDARGLISTK